MRRRIFLFPAPVGVPGLLTAVLLAAVGGPFAWAVTYTWNYSDQGGEWSNSSNWTPSGYPNGSEDIAQFSLTLSAGRTITFSENITLNQLTSSNSNNSYRLDIGSSAYTLTMAGTNPQIKATHSAGGDPGMRIYAIVDVGTVPLQILGYGVGFFSGVQGSADITVGDGSTTSWLELRGDSPNYSGNFIVTKGGILQARASTSSNVLGDTTGKTIIQQGGWFQFRDIGNNPTFSEPFVIRGVHSRGSIQAFVSNVRINGPITLNGANGSFSVRDWNPDGPNGQGSKRTFTINSVIDDGTDSKDVYFLGDYDWTGQGLEARKNVIVLGAQSTYGGNTYITSNCHDPVNPFVGNVRLAISNALPTSTKLILGGKHDAGGGVYIGIPEGNGKLILNGYNQELAGLETAGTGTANRVVGGSTTTSTLTLNIPASTTNTYSGYLGGPDTNENNLALTKTGPGTLTLSGANTYTGVTTVQAGVLQITHGNALGASGSGQGTTVANYASLEVAGGITVYEPISITGGGDPPNASYYGALRSVSGDNTWAGPITVNGWSRIGVRTNGTFTLSGGITGDGVPAFCGTAWGTIRITQNPINIGTRSLQTLDQTTLLLEVAGNTWGNTYITHSGTLKLGIDNAMPTGTVVTIGSTTNTNGTLDLNGYLQTIGGLTDQGTGSRRVTNSSANFSTLTINNTSNYTFAGVIEEEINLIKQGTGPQTLSGNNTYTGTTTVLGGTLALVSNTSNNNIASSSAIRVEAGATLDVTGLGNTGTLILANGQTLQGNGTVSGNVQAPVGSVLGAGMSPGHLTISGNYSQAGTLLVELAGYTQGGTQALPGQWATNGYDWVSVGGSAVLDGTLQIDLLAGFQPASGDVFNVLTAANGITDGGLQLQWDPQDLLPAQYWTYRIIPGQGGNEQILQLQLAVPEPASLVLLLLGGAALALARWRVGLPRK